MQRHSAVYSVAMLLMAATFAAAAADPEVVCQGGKVEAAGKLAGCLTKAKKAFLTSGDQTKYDGAVTKCTTSFANKWQSLEEAAVAKDAACPSVGDQSSVQADVARFVNCQSDKANSINSGNCWRAFPATGHVTPTGYPADGDIQAGAPMSFTDNGDGTVTDENTGLMWEQKDDAGGTRDKDNTYTWSASGNLMNGTVVTAFLDELNDVAGGGEACFAGYCDWRLPNVKELQTIEVYAVYNYGLRLPPALNVSSSSEYWTSTTYTSDAIALTIEFFNGLTPYHSKTSARAARAVRGGL